MVCSLAPSGYSLKRVDLLLLLIAHYCDIYYTIDVCDLQGTKYMVRAGGDEGARTPDLDSAIVALSQLSYVPLRNR